MSRDIYTGYHGAMTAWRQMEVVSNNVANVNTHGFKAQELRFVVDENGNEGGLSPTRAAISEVAIDRSAGQLEATGDPTHLGVNGEGWLVVQGEGGQDLLTRNGKLQVQPDGSVLAAGLPLMTDAGPLRVEPTQSFSVEPSGRVLQGGEPVGTLRLVSAEELEPLGGSLYQAQGPVVDATATVEQGHLERSNVNPMDAMIDLIMASRHLEIAQKALQASEEMDRNSARNGSPK